MAVRNPRLPCAGADERVLVAPTSFGDADPAPLERLSTEGFLIERNTTGRRLTAGEVVERGRGCAGIIAGVEPLGATVLQQLPSLRCISESPAGLRSPRMAPTCCSSPGRVARRQRH